MPERRKSALRIWVGTSVGHLTAPSSGGLAIETPWKASGKATLPAAAGSFARSVGMAMSSGAAGEQRTDGAQRREVLGLDAHDAGR